MKTFLWSRSPPRGKTEQLETAALTNRPSPHGTHVLLLPAAPLAANSYHSKKQLTDHQGHNGGISLVQHEDSWKQTSNTAAAGGAPCPSLSPSPGSGDMQAGWLRAAVGTAQPPRTPYRIWREEKALTGLHIILNIIAHKLMQGHCHFSPPLCI